MVDGAGVHYTPDRAAAMQFRAPAATTNG